MTSISVSNAGILTPLQLGGAAEDTWLIEKLGSLPNGWFIHSMGWKVGCPGDFNEKDALLFYSRSERYELRTSSGIKSPRPWATRNISNHS